MPYENRNPTTRGVPIRIARKRDCHDAYRDIPHCAWCSEPLGRLVHSQGLMVHEHCMIEMAEEKALTKHGKWRHKD